MDLTTDSNAEIILELSRGGPSEDLVVVLSGTDATKENLLRHFTLLMNRLCIGESIIVSYGKKE